MNDENRNLLESEIRVELANLGAMEMGSEPYKVAIDGLTKLMDRSINLKKLEMDADDNAKDREVNKKLKNKHIKLDDEFKKRQLALEIAIKRRQMRNEKSGQSITNGIAIASIVIPSIITVWGTFKTLKFEEHGTVTTIMGRGFINKLIPKK